MYYVFVNLRNINMLKAWMSELHLRRLPQFLQQLSTAAQVQPYEHSQSFRTTENNPLNHTLANVGHFYRIAPKIYKQLFTYGGIPKTYNEQIKTFTENCLMVRKPAVDIISCLKAIDFSKPAVRFVLYGMKGTGKSLSLAHILHYAHEAGFIIVHVPWVGNWMRQRKEISNSERIEGHIDLNLDAAAWLIHFKNQNSHLLSNPGIKTTQTYEWSKREVTPAESPLLSLIDHGINRIKYASWCVVVLAEELKKLSTSGKCKTLVAVDGYNALYYANTRIRNEKKEMVPPSRVTLTEAFRNLTNFDWNNGVAVVTVDEIAIAEEDQISYLPKYLLGKEGFEHLDPFIPILVSDYSKKELTSCMDYYRERRWTQVVPEQDDEVAVLSASNPYKLMQLCNSL